MTDATRLRAGLKDYLDALELQRHRLRQRHEALQKAWHYTRSVYQGQGADQFEEAFRRASAVLEGYLQATDVMAPAMRIRLEALDRFDLGTQQEPGR